MTPNSHLRETPALGSPLVFRLDIKKKFPLAFACCFHIHS